MSNKQFISNLSSTYADVRKLDVKKINLKGKNILEYIKENTPTIKHSQDTRETVTENDLWGQWVETKSDGTIIIHNDFIIENPKGQSPWNTSISSVSNNEVYVNDSFWANLQTEKIQSCYMLFCACSNLLSFDSDLPNLIDGSGMFDSSGLISFTSKVPNLCIGANMFNATKLESFSSDLPNLKNGYGMFAHTKLESFSSDLSSLTYGGSMFEYCSNLKSFSSDLSGLTNGSKMFNSCTNLKSFSSDLSSLTTGGSMFNSCTNLKSFSSDLPNLTNGSSMFSRCSNLTSFSSDLTSLTNGLSMFYNCTNLTTFYSVLPSLTSGNNMFQGCTNLTTFTSDLSSLTNGLSMFYNCTNLASFSSDLSSLTNGSSMFNMCKLDAESVMYIADTIKDITAEKQLYIDGTIPYVTLSNDVYSATRGFMSDGKYVYTYNNPKPFTTTIGASYVGKLTLGINVTNNTDTIQQQLEDFAKEATFESWSDLKKHFTDKGWTVTFQYGGTSDQITYDLRNGEQIIPCQIFAKLVEADKDSAEYCTEDASTFYDIEWGHDVTNYDDFQQFDSLEDAMASWNVFPKENIIITEEEES